MIPPVGEVVHVRGAEGVCSAAIVVGIPYPDDPAAEELRLRVLYRAPVTEPVGSRDAEGVYSPEWAPQVVPNPDGWTTRRLDSWHYRYHA